MPKRLKNNIKPITGIAVIGPDNKLKIVEIMDKKEKKNLIPHLGKGEYIIEVLISEKK